MEESCKSLISSFDQIENLESVRVDANPNLSAFLGEKAGKTVILIAKPFPLKDPKFVEQLSQGELTFKNERFTKYEVEIPVRTELCLINPALDSEIHKFRDRNSLEVIYETAEMYKNEIEPKIRTDDVKWITDIFDGLTTGSDSSKEEVIYQDTSFVLLPDLKWDRRDLLSAYTLAIVTDRNIRSIRDLRRIHIPLLKHIDQCGKEVMAKKYGLPINQIRSYFHYHPTYWWLHIHFNMITCKPQGSSVDCAIPLITVINNLEILDNYYELATIPTLQPIKD